MTYGPVSRPRPSATWHDTLGWIGFSTDHAGDLWPDAELNASGIVRHEAFDELRRLQRMIHQAAPEGLRTTWTLARLIAGIEQLAPTGSRRLVVIGARVVG